MTFTSIQHEADENLAIVYAKIELYFVVYLHSLLSVFEIFGNIPCLYQGICTTDNGMPSIIITTYVSFESTGKI